MKPSFRKAYIDDEDSDDSDLPRFGGTCLQGSVNVPFAKLLKVFNLPSMYDPEGYKVTTEWYLLIEDAEGEEHPVTIYDWKRDGLNPWEYDVWHIGGHSSKALELIHALL